MKRFSWVVSLFQAVVVWKQCFGLLSWVVSLLRTQLSSGNSSFYPANKWAFRRWVLCGDILRVLDRHHLSMHVQVRTKILITGISKHRVWIRVRVRVRVQVGLRVGLRVRVSSVVPIFNMSGTRAVHYFTITIPVFISSLIDSTAVLSLWSCG